MLQHLVLEHIGWNAQPTLLGRRFSPLKWTLDGVGVAIERRFVEVSEVNAKLATAS